ncbi:MAG: DUF2147 domain-containing protein [Acetobacteraceae bacterium]|nr:MAG: DUF2147 domain-containing protein [Acetobacteraceae bacterium]
MRALALAAIALAGVTVAYADELNPSGQWEVSTGESRYRISLCGDGRELCAKLTWLRDDARTAENVALLNRYVVQKAKPDDPNTWVGTMQYDGTTYEATAKLLSSDAMELRSCSGVFCRSFTLHRL